MKTKIIGLLAITMLSFTMLSAQKIKSFEIKSPDGKIILNVEAGNKLQWSVRDNDQQIISPSAISLQLENGEILGANVKIVSSKVIKTDNVFSAVNYKKSSITDQFNQLIINCKGNYGVIFRVYDEGVAYRFLTQRKDELIVKGEEANFNFTADHKAFIPYMWDYRDGKIFNSSFEALYKEINISKFAGDSLAFMPVLVDVGNNKKAVILEADLEDYPGMYLNINETHKGFMGVFAPYPLEAKLNGYGGINLIPTKRADYIARVKGTRNFPWRIIVISNQDKDLLNNDIVQKLSSPSRLKDISWIHPGQVAWDWWNDRNISHVDFKAGMNTITYKYFIDFAANNKIKYIILDGGWSLALDLTKIRPELNLQEIIDYGKQKDVGVILWASWYAVTQQMDKVFPLYSGMGVKGFKIDFVDRDDQLAVASLYEIAEKAANNHLLIDFHGVYKPTGLQKTYPNVIGFEGVKGLENYKWAIEDQPRYVVTIPFVRMISGPMDYTPGAMRNSNKENFRPISSNPMSQGTRCQQLAMYVVFEAPLQMLSDNPTVYMKEQECTDFITKVPTTFDETVALNGKVGEYVAIARRKGEVWFAGAMSNWNERDLTLDFSFLGDGDYQAVVFKDGINSDRDATDYKKEVFKISKSTKLNIHMAPGGGWAARIEAPGSSFAQTGGPNIDGIKRKWLDIAYDSKSQSQKLDIYIPAEGEGPFPVILSIHGGAFMSGDKRDSQVTPMLEGLKHGYAVVSINYRLSGEAIFPAQIYDVKAALRWIKANTKQYNLNPDKVAAWGGSAGGHLSALLGTSGGVKELEDLTQGNADKSSRIQAVVDWFGPTDFLKMDEQLKESKVSNPMIHSVPDSPESLLIGKNLDDAPELVKAANPETYITKDDPPFFIQHGLIDHLVPYQGSVNLAKKLEQILGKENVTIELLPGTDHGGPNYETEKNISKVFVFLDKYLKKQNK